MKSMRGVPNGALLRESHMVIRTVAESAAQLRLSDRAVYDLCSAGMLRHLRLGRGAGSIRILQDDLDRYVQACIVGGDEGGLPSKD